MDTMCGFDFLGCDEVAVGDFDYMNLLKGAAGMMQGAGGMMSGGQQQGGGGGSTAAAATAAQQQQQQQLAVAKAQAESSARTWKIVGGIALGVVGLTGLAFVVRR